MTRLRFMLLWILYLFYGWLLERSARRVGADADLNIDRGVLMV